MILSRDEIMQGSEAGKDQARPCGRLGTAIGERKKRYVLSQMHALDPGAALKELRSI